MQQPTPSDSAGLSDGLRARTARAAFVEVHVPETSESATRRIRLPAALAYVVDPIIVVDAAGKIAAATPSVGRLLGWRADELVGKPIAELAPTLDVMRRHSQEPGERLPGAISHNWRALLRQRDGADVPIGVSVGAEILDDEGERMLCLVLQDLTERHQAERMLHLFRRLTVDLEQAASFEEASGMAIAEFCEAGGWDAGQVWIPHEPTKTMRPGPTHTRDPEWNYGAVLPERRFRFGEGLPGVAYLFKATQWIPDVTVAGPEMKPCVADALEFSYRTALGAPVVVGGECPAVLTFYARRLRHDEEHSVTLASMAAAQLASTIRRRRSERALLESERRFRETLNTLPLLGVILDRRGRIAYCNQHFLAALALSEGQALGRAWTDFIPPEQRESVHNRLAEALTRGAVDPAEESQILLPSGDRRLIDWRLTLTHDGSGAIAGVALVGMDITEERRALDELRDYRNRLEELVAERTQQLERTNERLRIAERLASIGTLAAGLGHDMNNMLLPISCRLDALAQCDLDPKAQSHAEAVRESVGYLQQLSDGLHMLNASPSEEDDRAAVTSLAEWAQQAEAVLRQACPKRVQLDIDVPEGLPPVAVSPPRITQSIMNLVSNAGDAVEEEGAIRVFAELGGEGFVRLAVQDNGRGMTEQQRRHALDPFFTTKQRSMSTGLGLSLVHSVATSAGGDVQIDSAPDRGTTVSMLLPRAPERARSESLAGRARVRVRDPRIASVVESVLERASFEVIEDDEDGRDTDLLIADQPDDTPARRVLLLAPENPGAGGTEAPANAVRIDPGRGFRAIRQAVEEAAQFLSETDT